MKKIKKIPDDEPCETPERLNVSNRIISTELGECSLSTEIQNQNVTYYMCLPFSNEQYTALIGVLIEETTYYFATRWQREHLEYRRRNYRKDQRIMLENGDIGKGMDWSSAANRACLRDKFLTRAGLQPPQMLRVIDIEATCRHEGQRVVLIDYWADDTVQQVGYTAISHTYGMEIYEAFNCPCASECSTTKVRPRCSNKACPHQDDASSLVGAGSEKQKRAVNDILRMCHIFRKSGVIYAWHDGVCIAQHDDAEVEETIKHIGWIYANAKETVIFLHYVGRPMAPIRNSNDGNELCCRWHTRVWTLQEAALSKCRRYCVRVGAPLGDCESMKEFEEKIDLWYGDDSSTIEIMEEERFCEFVMEIHRVLCYLLEKVLSIPDDADDDVIAESNWMWNKATTWCDCTGHLIKTLLWTCFEFPTMEKVLCLMCCARDSKHRGDRMNSILALAKVKDFVARKDVNVEASTIEFFKRCIFQLLRDATAKRGLCFHAR